MVIYSDPGVGKTHFVTGIPNHVMIRTGDGLGKLTPNAFPMSESYSDVMEQIQVLIDDDHDYQVLAIDTLTMFEHLLQKHATDHWNAQPGISQVKQISDVGYGAGYAHCMLFWHEFLDHLRVLQEKKNMAVILLAHSDEKSGSDALNPAFKRFKVKIDKRPNTLLVERCDLIAYLKLNTALIKEDAGFGTTNVRADTTGRRVLCVDVHPAYEAKNRYSLPAEVPANWEKLMELIGKKEAQAVSTETAKIASV